MDRPTAFSTPRAGLFLDYTAGKPEDKELSQRMEELEGMLEQLVHERQYAAKISTRVADIGRKLRRLIKRPCQLDLVDTLTLMELSVGGGDVAATWHAVRKRLGVEDDGSSAERVRRLGTG